ncbi:DinB family protein [Gorillibacterium timonense]|uniref:DinB family protein n=1 Tax=Gorillibacterium timonense TaxID=1689269 RepID=UPI001F39C628|nr:DinB family protein [Gorillibacterium timonense]
MNGLMDYATLKDSWNDHHKKLTGLILKPNEYDHTLALFLNQHALLYSSKLTRSAQTTFEDALFRDAEEDTLRKYPVNVPGTINSIVWHVWHIARIEDMTMNVLVADQDQIFFTGNWDESLAVDYAHTGNGMTEAEIADLSFQIDIAALLSYRLEVGKKTREIIGSLRPEDFKRKVEPGKIQKLEEQAAVKKEASWLLDYWGSKTIAGLVLMPATRHNFLHLNKSIRIKQKLQKIKDTEVFPMVGSE